MEIEENQQESWSKTKKRTPSFSNKTRNGSNKKTTRFKEEEELVEIVFDLGDDDNIGDGSRESEAALLATGLKKRMSSSKKVDRGAHVALKSLKFMTSKNFEDNGWSQVKKLFHDLALDDKLHRNKFGECIGTKSCY
ncbi:PREDICTED: respiratory burst oxidase homolog protein B-like [Lupinus angustifolius]|uniref:respiratory burst oxidase homolog protein B-like n=1 Tax=Lupinus angustifolius TaxID=3871 RepID=UPI00092F5831|nr:PREDICTED: respiratory burst oxidase homolog protein B-like [Lupinus angustifolius]